MESMPKNTQLPEGYSYHPEGYVWLVLSVEKFSGLPETVEVHDKVLTKKSEFHATVINARSIARELAGSNLEAIPEIEEELQKMLTEYVSDTPIEFEHFNDDLRLATSSERMSIAARCTMRNVEGYFDLIKSKYGREFPIQPAHVSIYTLNGAAVGIDSIEEIESFPKIELPAVHEALSSID